MFIPILILTTSFLTAQAEILLGPSDTEAVIGSDVTLRCSLATQQSSACSVEWTHKRRTWDMFQVIYTSCFMIGEFGTRHSVVGNASRGEYNLKITNISPEDFGTYTCRDNTDGSQSRAQLIVFDAYPSNEFCSIIEPHDGPIGNNTCGIEPDEVKLSCNMSCNGNAIPTMEWIQADGDIITSNITTTRYNGNVTVSSLVLNADRVQSTAYTCRIKYLQPRLESNISWSTTLHIFHMMNRTDNVLMETSSKELNCTKAGLAENCSFSWEHDGKRLSDKGSVLNVTEERRGIYTCSAVCNIRGRNCSITPIAINVSSDQQTASMSKSIFICLSIVAVVLLLGLLLGACYISHQKENLYLILKTF